MKIVCRGWDLAPLRQLKVQLLNGAHTALVPVGLQAGFRTVHEFVSDPQRHDWLRGLLIEDLAQPLEQDLGKEVVFNYCCRVLERFANPFVEHLLESILLNSLAKWPVRQGPTVDWYLAHQLPIPERLLTAWQAELDIVCGRSEAEVPDAPERISVIKKVRPDLLTFLGYE